MLLTSLLPLHVMFFITYINDVIFPIIFILWISTITFKITDELTSSSVILNYNLFTLNKNDLLVPSS